jgi:hypothetical protein
LLSCRPQEAQVYREQDAPCPSPGLSVLVEQTAVRNVMGKSVYISGFFTLSSMLSSPVAMSVSPLNQMS